MTASLSSNDSLPEALAFRCAEDGRITHVALSSIDGASAAEGLIESVAPSSAKACSAFLTGIQRGGFARAPLRIGNRDLHCFGWCERGEIRVVCVVDPVFAATAAEMAAAQEDDGFTRLAEEIRRAHSTYELYEELARLNNELVTSQRELARTVAELRRLNEYKDELLGMAAHDLRNPLDRKSVV